MLTSLFLPSLLFWLSLTSNTAQPKNALPNIIVILADDMGYGDIMALNKNGKIKTPNLDRMASSGISFTDAHSSSSVCTPTRYGLLTGRYNWRSPLKNGVLGMYAPPLIAPGRTTMASMLAKQGYQTACIGKWHLGFNWTTTDGKPPRDTKEGNNIKYSQALTGGPTDVGFSYFFGVDAPNYPPYTYIENKQVLGVPDQFYSFEKELDCRSGGGVKGWELENIFPTLQRKTVGYLNEAFRKKSPVFLYLPLTAPHTPIVPDRNFRGKSGLNAYADFVMQVDALVGEIIKTLESNQALSNTILVFTSDNGCSPQANFAELAANGHDPGYVFRGMKSDIFEGGHRVPFLVQWPGKIEPGQQSGQIISLNDLMGTFATITGYPLADNEAEDSFSLMPLFTNSTTPHYAREAVVHHSINGSFAIRRGKWKLELCSDSGGWSDPKPGKAEGTLPAVQLYDLEKDAAETRNVQADHPQVVKELTELLQDYVQKGRSTPGKPQANDGTFLEARMKWLAN